MPNEIKIWFYFISSYKFSTLVVEPIPSPIIYKIFSTKRQFTHRGIFGTRNKKAEIQAEQKFRLRFRSTTFKYCIKINVSEKTRSIILLTMIDSPTWSLFNRPIITITQLEGTNQISHRIIFRRDTKGHLSAAVMCLSHQPYRLQLIDSFHDSPVAHSVITRSASFMQMITFVLNERHRTSQKEDDEDGDNEKPFRVQKAREWPSSTRGMSHLVYVRDQHDQKYSFQRERERVYRPTSICVGVWLY